MSRGPGRWQRLLLEALEDHTLVPVSYVVYNNADSPTRSDHVAARRAARRLVKEGKARATYRRGLTMKNVEGYLLCLSPPDAEIYSDICPTNGYPDWVEGMAPSAAPMSREDAERLTEAIRRLTGADRAEAQGIVEMATPVESDFEKALARARSEGDVSRENVIRHLQSMS